MTNVAETIERIIALAPPTPANVAAALQVTLAPTHTSPTWAEHTGGPCGDLLTVRLKLGRSDGTWLLVLQYDPAKAPPKSSIAMTTYGAVTNIDVNPRIPPEGTQTFQYKYHDLDLAFEFTARTQVLRSISLANE